MRKYISIIFLLLVMSGSVQAQGFLRVSGQQINNDNGPVLLRGVGLGGWMLQEPYMLQLGNAAKAQYDIKNKLIDLAGQEATDKFYDSWLANQCTKADIDSLAAWGFNSIRMPLHYNLFTLPVDKEPVAGKSTWLKKGFAITDSLVRWCSADHIYVIFDLHAAPGGQGNDIPIADRDASRPSLWESEANQQKTIALWQQIARRYANEIWVGGYDMLNEPNWGFQDPTDEHGAKEETNIPLRKLLMDITAAIRQVDKHHILYLEGNCWANNYKGLFPLWDNNTVVSFHKYWNFTTNGSIQNFLDYRKQYNVPLWLGETGENSNSWFTDVVTLLEKNNIGWCMWPLKKAGLNNMLQIPINPGFEAIINYWKDKGPRPSAEEARAALAQFAENANIKNNIVHPRSRRRDDKTGNG